MTRRVIAAMALGVVLMASGSAEAQVFVGAGGPVGLSPGGGGPWVGASYAGAPAPGYYYQPFAYGYAPPPGPGPEIAPYTTFSGGQFYYIPPYSYYAAQYPFLSRDYVGYGANDFPYYGKPFGHPYDLWSWSYMSSSNGVLARYYYPALGYPPLGG